MAAFNKLSHHLTATANPHIMIKQTFQQIELTKAHAFTEMCSDFVI